MRYNRREGIRYAIAILIRRLDVRRKGFDESVRVRSMQMLPVPSSPPSSASSTTSIDNHYVDLAAVSTHIESLRLRLSPIVGNSLSPNRDANAEKSQLKPTPSRSSGIFV